MVLSGKRNCGVIRVFIISGSLPAAAGLERLGKSRAIKIAGTAANFESAEGLLFDANAEILLIDGTQDQPERLVRKVADSGWASELAVIILADNLPRRSLAIALRAGVRAVLSSDVSPEQLIAAVEAAASGLVVAQPRDVQDVLPAPATDSRETTELVEPLTPREREVLQMLAAGWGNKEIAARLAISEHTVKFHVTSILGKLGAETRTEAVSVGIRRGLVLL
jgi:DNA-binding NarL/FixJ family response regulator